MRYQKGEPVRYHPVEGGPHDGKVYEVVSLRQEDGEESYWLGGSFTYVPLRKLSPVIDVDDERRKAGIFDVPKKVYVALGDTRYVCAGEIELAHRLCRRGSIKSEIVVYEIPADAEYWIILGGVVRTDKGIARQVR